MSALKFPEDHGQKKLSGNIRLIDVKSQDLMDLGKTVYHSIPVNIQILRRMIDMISRKKILFQTSVKIRAFFPGGYRPAERPYLCVSGDAVKQENKNRQSRMALAIFLIPFLPTGTKRDWEDIDRKSK